jgi:hypothetical protein
MQDKIIRIITTDFIKFLKEQLLNKRLSSTGIMKGTLPSNNPLDGE